MRCLPEGVIKGRPADIRIDGPDDLEIKILNYEKLQIGKNLFSLK